MEIETLYTTGKLTENKGIIISGLRNTGEINPLRKFRNFYLLSIHADRPIREKRLLADHKVTSKADFQKIDERDSDEGFSYGQQIKRCNDLADIIINNQDEFPERKKIERENYVKSKIIDKYIYLFEKILSHEQITEHWPTLDEKFMTAAFCESTSSKCLKRKVGAVIAKIETIQSVNGEKKRERGYIISSGYNDVPGNIVPCIDDISSQKCTRDSIKEEIAVQIKNCPYCGRKITLAEKCKHCSSEVSEFRKSCPRCEMELDIKYICPNRKCKKDVFKTFLPGESSGKLLDMCRSLHAEENAIMNLIKSGASINQQTSTNSSKTVVNQKTVLYTTTYPCNLCANKIAELNMDVVYADPYPMEEAKLILEQKGISPKKFEGVKSSMFFELFGN